MGIERDWNRECVFGGAVLTLLRERGKKEEKRRWERRSGAD